jgi:hypothetical protein
MCHAATFANDAEVEIRVVLPLLHALGYEDSDIHPKYPVDARSYSESGVANRKWQMHGCNGFNWCGAD